jgi:hypothetical protein
MKYAVEMTSGGIIYITRFMMTGLGIKAILIYYLNSLRGRNVGNIYGRDL